MTSMKIWPSPKVVVIGGGTGTSTILRGLKQHTDEITAIITVMDDGGSTGRLRKDLDIIAPGDIRNCLIALSNSEDEIDKLLDYRFSEGEMSGHSFGNLFIAAMNGVYKDFSTAIRKTADILKITGQVLPITLTNTNLVARLENGHTVRGESSIPNVSHSLKSKIQKMYTEPDGVEMVDEAKMAIEEADIVILGPGSLYTSIIPNLLVNDMVELLDNCKGKVCYVCNIMDQEGETEKYTISDHYDAIINHSKEGIIDYVIANSGQIDSKLLEKYDESNSHFISCIDEDRKYLDKQNVKLIEAPIVKVKNSVIRHDADKLAEIIFRDVLMGA